MRGRALAVGLVGILGIALIIGAVGSFRSGITVPDLVRQQPTSLALGPQYRLLATLGDPAQTQAPGWPGIFDARPTAYDLNGDGVDEVVAQSNDTHTYVFDASSGRILARLPTTYPPRWYIDHVLNGAAAGTLRAGEPASLITASGAAYVTHWQYDPAQSGAHQHHYGRVWEQRMTTCFPNPSMDATPVLADVDRDGVQEILVQTEEVGLYALRANGSILWHQCWGGGNSDPLVDDLDGDGRLEAIFTSDAGLVSILDAATGTPRWSFDAADPRHGIRPGSISVSPTIAQLDGAGSKEILFTARHVPDGDPSRYRDYHMAIFALTLNRTSGKAEVLWSRQPDWAHPLSYTRLVVSDVDRDGKPDVFGMDWNTPGHNPGHWENLGPAHVFRLDAHGQDVWVRTLDVWWSNKDILLDDTDRDGNPELIVNGARPPSDGLWRLDPRDGKPVGYVPLTPWKVLRAPIVAEPFHDGRRLLIVSCSPQDEPDRLGGLLVYET